MNAKALGLLFFFPNICSPYMFLDVVLNTNTLLKRSKYSFEEIKHNLFLIRYGGCCYI